MPYMYIYITVCWYHLAQFEWEKTRVTCSRVLRLFCMCSKSKLDCNINSLAYISYNVIITLKRHHFTRFVFASKWNDDMAKRNKSGKLEKYIYNDKYSYAHKQYLKERIESKGKYELTPGQTRKESNKFFIKCCRRAFNLPWTFSSCIITGKLSVA